MASVRPEGRRAAISSSVRFAASHSRSSARNCSTSAGYEKSTFLDFGSLTFARLTAIKPDFTSEQIFGQHARFTALLLTPPFGTIARWPFFDAGHARAPHNRLQAAAARHHREATASQTVNT